MIDLGSGAVIHDFFHLQAVRSNQFVEHRRESATRISVDFHVRISELGPINLLGTIAEIASAARARVAHGKIELAHEFLELGSSMLAPKIPSLEIGL